MTTGQPMGITYIDGVSFGTSSYDNFFAILKDGKTAVIDYAKNIGNYVDADGNSTIWQAAAGSQWLVRDGKDVTAGAASNTGFVNPYQEPGWNYLSIDLSAYKGLYLHQGYIVQFYISDRDGAGITSIGRYAFSHLYECTSITFAEGSKLEKIEVTGFYYDFQVTSVVLPETARSIGVLAFGNMYRPDGSVCAAGRVHDRRQRLQGQRAGDTVRRGRLVCGAVCRESEYRAYFERQIIPVYIHALSVHLRRQCVDTTFFDAPGTRERRTLFCMFYISIACTHMEAPGK